MNKHLFLAISLVIISQASGCEDGWTRFNQSCYKWYTWINTDYQTASQLCKTNVAEMLTINTEEEQDFITDHFSHIENNIWLDAENSNFENWLNESLYDVRLDPERPCASVHYLNRTEAKWIKTECFYDYEVVCKTGEREVKYLLTS